MKVASLALALAASAASATTVYVNVNSPAPAAPYDSWANACDDIATAVSYAAGSGADEVLVTNGTYALSSTIQLNGLIALRSVEGAAATILDGQNSVRPLELYNGATIDGFTVENGYAASGHGGGILVNYGTVDQCVVTRCTANAGNGGGIHIENGLVNGCVVTYCQAHGSDGNSGGGGGISVYGGAVRSCLVAGNECDGGQGHVGGGGIYAYHSPVVENCTIIRNKELEQSSDSCGGFFTREQSNPSVRNCIIRDNDGAGSNPNWFAHSWGGTITASHNNLPTGFELGTDAVTGDPQFVGSGSGYGLSAVLGDYHIPRNSPCARAGSLQSWMSIALDADGVSRLASPTSNPDLGAYTVPSSGFTCDFSVSPSRGMAPLAVSFSAMVDVQDAANAQLTYYWDFDNDGSYETNGAVSAVSWTYTAAGSYSPRLRVENAADGTSCEYVATDGVFAAPSAIYVSPNGSETAPYDTLAKATRSVATAIAAAADGMTIYIDTGVYPLGETLEVAAGATVASLDKANPAVLDGQGVRRCMVVSHASAVIDGLVISNGYSNASGDQDAGKGCGILLVNGTVRDCTITSCTGDNGAWGAGIYAKNGLVYRSRIVNNRVTGVFSAGGGAGLEGTATLRGCVVMDNYCWGQQGHLGGGGVFLTNGGIVENCTIVENTDNANGDTDGAGGLYIFNSSGTSYVTNSIICTNTVENGNGSHECYLRMGNVTAGYNCTAPAFGDDCVTQAPVFTDAANGDWSLAANSPGSFQGANLAWMAGETDIAGNPRIDARVGQADIGAYASVAAADTLVCEYTVNYTPGIAPVTVSFSSRVFGTATGSITYYWDFDGDGTTDLSGPDCVSPTHTYTVPGTYSPVLVATNASPLVSASAVIPDCVTVSATAVYVAAGNAGVVPYDTPANAAPTIAAAMAFVGPGTEAIHVAAGRYAVVEPIVLSSAITLSGVGADETILDGGGATRLVELANASAVCEGVTLANGRTFSENGGAGALLSAGALRGCVISNCYADAKNDGSNGGGGVMFSQGSTAVMENCRIVRNTSTRVGGGVYFYNTGTMRNCLIAANACGGGEGHVGGGGVSCYYGGATIDNCTIVGNNDEDPNPGYNGGGFYLFYGNTTLRNCLLYGNTHIDEPVDISGWTGNANGTIVSNCFVGTGYGDVPAALTGDPLLRNVGGTAGLGYNFADCRLLPDSPCVNAGATLSWMEGATDLEGNPRVAGAAPDIGCYEFRVQGTAILLR